MVHHLNDREVVRRLMSNTYLRLLELVTDALVFGSKGLATFSILMSRFDCPRVLLGGCSLILCVFVNVTDAGRIRTFYLVAEHWELLVPR